MAIIITNNTTKNLNDGIRSFDAFGNVIVVVAFFEVVFVGGCFILFI